jgi:hypothetical protein
LHSLYNGHAGFQVSNDAWLGQLGVADEARFVDIFAGNTDVGRCCGSGVLLGTRQLRPDHPIPIVPLAARTAGEPAKLIWDFLGHFAAHLGFSAVFGRVSFTATRSSRW